MKVWAPVAAAAAVVVVTGGVLLLRPGGRPDPTPAAPPPAYSAAVLDVLRIHDGDTVTASGTVVVAPGRPVLFCPFLPEAGVGGQPPRPPACSRYGVTVTGVDAARLTGVQTYQATRWGNAHLTGRYADNTLTVTTQGPPIADPADPAPGTFPFTPPCPAPAGGWRAGPVDHAGLDAVERLFQAQPESWGDIVMTYPDGAPTGDGTHSTQVVMVTTTLDPAAAEKAVRARFGGNLCVQKTPRSRAATDAVWDKVRPEHADWTAHRVLGGGPEHWSGKVKLQLAMVDDATYRWLIVNDGRTIDVQPWLRPVRPR